MCSVYHKTGDLSILFNVFRGFQQTLNNEIYDGIQWEIKITCNDGSHLDFYGSNEYPPYYEELLSAFRPFFKKQVLRLKNSSHALQLLCTDMQVLAEEADKVLMRAWNFLVSHGLRYSASFREMAREGKDELVRYRAREMGGCLVKGAGYGSSIMG